MNVSGRFLDDVFKAYQTIFAMVALCVTLASCGNTEPEYLRDLRGAAPSNALPASIKTNGPFGRPILRIAIDDIRAAVVTEGTVKGQYMIWSTNDLRNWTWRAFTQGLPSALVPHDRLYWFVTGSLFSADYTNQPQTVAFPYDGTISELVPYGSNFLAVSGTAALYSMSENGHWSELAKVAPTEQLTTLARTSQGICAISQNTRNAWFWTDTKSSAASAATIPASAGDLKQLVSTTSHTYLLTASGLLEGDLGCGSWREISLPSGTGERYSLAAGETELYLATGSGLYRYEGTAWNQFPTQITRSLVRRLRAIDGTLYACHSGGLDESSDFGQNWKPSGKPIGVGPPVQDVTSYQGLIYAATDQGLYKKDQPDGSWSAVSLPPAAPTHLKYLASNEQGYLVIVGPVSAGRNLIWVLDPSGAKWTATTSGLENVHGFNAFQTVGGVVYAPTDIGLFRLDTTAGRWIADPSNWQFGSVPAVAAFGDKGLVLATVTHDLWYTENPLAPGHQWKRFLDNSAIKNYPAPINDIWSDPKDSNDTFFATWGQFLFNRDNQVIFASRPDFGEGFSFASIRSKNAYYLFLGNDFGVDYIDRKYVPTSWISYLLSWYQKHSGTWWFWPINLVLFVLGLYFAAVVSVLVLLYLPIPGGLIGTRWLITQIAKFVSISPLLGRWIIFVGYPERLRRSLAERVKLEEGNRYQILREGPGAKSETSDLLAQVASNVSTRRFTLIEHDIFQLFPEYLAMSCVTDHCKGTALATTLPILIPASEWKDSVSTSGSQVLRNIYLVPLDEDEMLKGQIERGDLLFIFQNIEQLGDKLSEFLNEIRSTIEIPLQKCYFVGCCNSASNPLLSQLPKVLHVVAKNANHEPSPPKV